MATCPAGTTTNPVTGNCCPEEGMCFSPDDGVFDGPDLIDPERLNELKKVADVMYSDLAQAAEQDPSANDLIEQWMRNYDEAVAAARTESGSEQEIRWDKKVFLLGNSILDLLGLDSVEPPSPPTVAGKSKFDVGKLVLGLGIVAGIGALVYFAGRKRTPLGGFGDVKWDDRDKSIGPMTWENRYGFAEREIDREKGDWYRGGKYLPFPSGVGPVKPLPATAATWRTKDNSEVVARLLKTKEWRGSTAVDMGDVIEIRHPGGAVARIIKQRPVKQGKKGRR